jgi:hypothetical protein
MRQSERMYRSGGVWHSAVLTLAAVLSGTPVRVINWPTISFWLEVIGGILSRLLQLHTLVVVGRKAVVYMDGSGEN